MKLELMLSLIFVLIGLILFFFLGESSENIGLLLSTFLEFMSFRVSAVVLLNCQNEGLFFLEIFSCSISL